MLMKLAICAVLVVLSILLIWLLKKMDRWEEKKAPSRLRPLGQPIDEIAEDLEDDPESDVRFATSEATEGPDDYLLSKGAGQRDFKGADDPVIHFSDIGVLAVEAVPTHDDVTDLQLVRRRQAPSATEDWGCQATDPDGPPFEAPSVQVSTSRDGDPDAEMLLMRDAASAASAQQSFAPRDPSLY